MSEIRAASTIALFFALRCIAPLLITVGIGYLMNRLVDRWEAEQDAAGAADPIVLALEPIVKERSSATGALPCWVVRNCDASAREDCPAYKDQSLPCWIVRLVTEGAQPVTCQDCPVYDPRLAIS